MPDDLLWSFIYEGMVPANRLRLGIATYREGEEILEHSMAGFARLVPRLQQSCKGAMNLNQSGESWDQTGGVGFMLGHGSTGLQGQGGAVIDDFPRASGSAPAAGLESLRTTRLQI